MLAFFPFRFSLVVIFSIGCLSTLVPEEFLDPRSGEDASQNGEKRKPLVTLDLNLTFMHTPGSVSDPQARIGSYFYKHANHYDWFV